MRELTALKPSKLLLWLEALSVVLVPVAFFWILATNRSPSYLRSLSMILRTGYAIVIPILYFALYLVFRLRGWIGKLLSLSLTLSIFALALVGVWVNGKTEAWLLSGVIPMFDAAHYYADVLRLIAGQGFSQYSANKPLFSALFAVLLWIAKHNLLTALIFLDLLVALGCYLLANEINRTHGPETAAFVLLVIFVYARIHSGVVRTENLGILFSVLGTALIWRGIAEHQRRYFLAGIFVTSLALFARPGPLFTLPAIIVWGTIFFRSKESKFSWKFMLGGIVAVLLAFVANLLIFWSFGSHDSLPFGRFPYALYGLVSGGNSWAYVFQINPNVTEPEIYKMAFELFKEQPFLVIKGIIHNLSMFFSNTGYGLYSYMGGEGELASTISYWLLLSLSSVGFLSWIRNRDNPYLGFVVTAAIGLIASVPFLPPTDAFRLRLYAGSIVILALLPALGFRVILNYLHLTMPITKILENSERIYRVSTPLLTIVVITLVFFAPLAIRGIEPPPSFGKSYCTDDTTSLIVRYDPGTMIHLLPQNVQFLDQVPFIHIRTFRQNIHDFPSFDLMDWALEKVGPNTTMFYTLDYRSYYGALVLVNSDALPTPPALLELCGKWEENSAIESFNIFYPTSVFLLNQE